MTLTIILAILSVISEIVFFCITKFYTYIWPIVVGVVGLPLVYYAWCFIVIIYLFITSLIMGSTKEIKKPSKYANWWFINVNYILVWIAGVRIKYTNKDIFPNENCLIVTNHISNYDPMLVMYTYYKHHLYFVTKPGNKDIPVCGPYIHHAGAISINRENPKEGIKAIKKASEYIKEYGSMYIAPEGTRSKDYKLHDFHPGTFKAAYWAECPIVVISIRNTQNIHKNFPFKSTVCNFDVLKVLNYDEYKDKTTNEVAEYCHDLIANKLKEYEK